MSTHTVVLIPGDGIGPEVALAVRSVFEAIGAPVRFLERQAGKAALARGHSKLLPEETLDAIREHHLALKGPCTTPIGRGFESVNVALRKELSLYAALRPVRSLPGVRTRYKDVDLIIIRENTEGLYGGGENLISDGVAVAMKVATRGGCRRIANWGFRCATQYQRKKLTVFHKANILKLTDGMLLDEARKSHAEIGSALEYEEHLLDSAQMRLVQDPSRFDVILCENLYGDIVSDLCAGLVGGLGVCPGANFGDQDAVFEAVHGSAPDIAGQDKANPLALLMSATMLLDHIAEIRSDERCRGLAARIRFAYEAALADGQTTADLGGVLGTREFTRALIERLQAQLAGRAVRQSKGH